MSLPLLLTSFFFSPSRAASKEQLVFYTFRFDPRGRTAETVQARLSSYDGSTKSGHGAQVATINALQTSAHHAATATGANSGAGPEAGGESMGHEAVQKQMAKVQRANAALRQELEEQRAEVDSLASQLRKADDHAKKAAAAARAELAQATAKIASEVEVAREAQRAAEAALEASQQECAKWKADCAAAEAAKSAEAARGEDKVRQLRCAEGELEAREARVKDLAAMVGAFVH
jgi:colicin import membrane protein